jgi:hypothetical protein
MSKLTKVAQLLAERYSDQMWFDTKEERDQAVLQMKKMDSEDRKLELEKAIDMVNEKIEYLEENLGRFGIEKLQKALERKVELSEALNGVNVKIDEINLKLEKL